MQEWEESGLDEVDLNTYTIYLSFPNASNPNLIQVLDGDDNVVYTTSYKEADVEHPNFVDSFSAYAPAGIAEDILVYVNYGTVEDMEYLDSIGVNLTGRIAISRYGSIFRGNKLQNVEQRGAIGLIIFSDPADVAPNGVSSDDVYPNSIFLPRTGMQRGTVFIDNGDPLSPFWASVPNAYRIEKSENELFPKIPCQPIGYEDAKVLLEKMAGPPSPDSWKGGIQGVAYNIGGENLPEFANHRVKLIVNNYEEDVQTSNVIGYLRGEVEPDRYVFLSNHR